MKIIEIPEKPSACTCCGRIIVPVLYGEPSEEAQKLSKEKKLIIGGCCESEDDPEWGCVKCETYYRIQKRKS